MYITNKTISRRAVLRGVGATIALPLLDSMIPALSAFQSPAARPTPRLGFIYVPNGVNQKAWFPSGGGGALTLSPILQPLGPFRDNAVLVSEIASAGNDGNHPSASAAWLTASKAKRTEGSDVYLGKSLDQIAADELGKETQLRSIQLAADDTVSVCDGYACSYQNSISWRTPTSSLPMQNNPRAAFERLFGSGASEEERRRIRRAQGSVLDSIREEASRLGQVIHVNDRARLRDYLDAVREVEVRIQKMEQQTDIEFPSEIPHGVPDSFDEHVKIMFDLLVMAYRADLTRVGTFMICREASQRTYAHIGVPEAHHGLSHHGDDPELLQKLTTIDSYHMQLFAYYLKKLADTPDGDGSLLDHTLLFYGSGIGNGNTHGKKNLPALIVGGANGKLKGGRHIVCAQDTPLANLQLTLMDKIGIHLEAFGDSTGRVSEL